MPIEPPSGSGAIFVELVRGRSTVVSCRAASPLRLLFPSVGDRAAWCFQTSFGGGLVDGDRLSLEVDVGAGAALLLATQASTKVYRGASSQALHARVGEGATLVVVPDPVVPFADARYAQRMTVDLAATSSLAFLDAYTAGRTAHGERWAFGRYESRLVVTRAGRTVLRDPFVLDPVHGALAARFGRFDAIASLVLLGPRVAEAAARILAELERVPVRASDDVVIAASPLGDGGALVRVAATDVRGLTHAIRARLAFVDELVGDDPFRGRPLAPQRQCRIGRMRLVRSIAALALSLSPLASCTPAREEPPRAPDGPLAAHARRVAKTHGVPGDLVLAIGAIEGGLRLARYREVRLDDEVPVAGVMELRRGRFDSLARGAALIGHGEDELRADTDLGTEAGALVLRELAGTASDDLAAWADAVDELSGHLSAKHRRDYVARVYRLLREGGSFAARGGETVVVPAHPEIPIALTIAPPGESLLDTPDSPIATQWADTPQAGKWDTSHDPKQNVAIHDTEGGWDASLATLQNDTGKSVHYMIDSDGSRVVQFVHEKVVAYHVGNYFFNQRTIGIEHVGVASDPNGYSDAMYATSVKLVKDITARWSIPIDRDHIFGHYQVPDGNAIAESSPPCGDGLSSCEKSPNYGGANNHRDPGYNWQWCQYMEWLGGSCNCNDAWPLWNCTTDLAEAWRCDAGKLEKQNCTGGCKVMPSGTPDECTTSGAAGAGGTGAAGSGAGGKASGGSAGKGGASAGKGGSSAGGASGKGGTSGGPPSGGSAGKGGSGGSSTSAGGSSSSAGGSSSGGSSTSGGGSGSGSGSSGSGSSGSSSTGGSGSPMHVVVPAAGESGSCAVHPASRRGGAPFAILFALATLAARRRRVVVQGRDLGRRR